MENIPRLFEMVWNTFNSYCKYKSSINFQLESLILEIWGASSVVPHRSTKLEAAPNLKQHQTCSSTKLETPGNYCKKFPDCLEWFGILLIRIANTNQ